MSQQQFWRTVTRDGRGPCALADEHVPCFGPMDAHHYFPKRRIKAQLGRAPGLELALGDTRNGVPLCRTHHDLVEGGTLESPRPELLDLFLVEHELHERPPLQREQIAGPNGFSKEPDSLARERRTKTPD